MADLRRFGFADFLLLVLVVALAGAARAGYLMTCCDNGRSPGPLLVQDPRFSFGGGSVGSDLDTGLSGRTRSSGKPANNDSAGPLAGFGGETDLDDLVASIKSAKSFDLDTFSSRSPFSRGKERS